MNNKSIALNVLHTHSDILQKISQYYKSSLSLIKQEKNK